MSALRNHVNKHPWRWPLALVLLLGVTTLFFSARPQPRSPKPPVLAYTQLDKRIAAHQVARLDFNPNTLSVVVHETSKSIPAYSVGVPVIGGSHGLSEVLQAAKQAGVPVRSLPVTTPSTGVLDVLKTILPMLLIFGFLYYMLRSYMPGSKDKIAQVHTNVTFADVAGCGEAIEELQDVRAFLSDQKKYERLGAKVPKGVLLFGPPGTGKTLLAKAVASEAGIPFYQISGAAFVEMYAGLGASRVRRLFAEAKKHAPSIIFIDELDSVGATRSSGGGDGGAREGDQTLNQLLTEIDGFTVSEHPVILMGATNRLETLDPALLRPGRFDRHIAIDPPNRSGRLDILNVHATGKRLAEDVDLEQMATHSSGMSGADLAQWLNEAALLAGRHSHDRVSVTDIDDAYFRILAGAKKKHGGMTASERKTVAYHEAGHAIVGERLKSTERVHKISIIPRGASGGQTISVSEEDVFLHSEQQLHDMLAMLMGGRAAEELIFGRVTSGAVNDLERATELAISMSTRLGMGKAMGLRVAVGKHTVSPSQRDEVDREIRELLDTEYARAKRILETDRPSLERISGALLVEETIDRDRFIGLLEADAS